MKTGTTCKTTKRYPRCTAGPLRHKYIHRIVAAALLGRELTKDEEVHHTAAGLLRDKIKKKNLNLKSKQKKKGKS